MEKRKHRANSPDAEHLRAWQRFVADNLEFRLGVALGAVVARAWSEGAPASTTPTLAEWRETSGLPWLGFWARELLRWGTHDPLVAFCLSQGLARTRDAATDRRGEFDGWLQTEVDDPQAEDRIDPQLFQRWRLSLPVRDAASTPSNIFDAELTGTDGHRQRYAVLPARRGDVTLWLDPAGFELAVTQGGPVGTRRFASDFELQTAGGNATVVRMFRPARR